MTQMKTRTRWVPPNLNDEMEEIIRTADELGMDEDKVLLALESGQMAELSPGIWQSLQNTDSYQISPNVATKLSLKYGRDLEGIKQFLESGARVPAPIILRTPKGFYLVAGNTRLMASQLLGNQPKVWVGTITESMEDTNSTHHEVEDFERVIELPSSQFAIVDADVVRHLQIPNAKDAVFITTKRSPSEKNLRFKITGRYDDATLRELRIEPSTDENNSPQEPVQEAAITGHDHGIDKVTRKHTSIKGLRRNRNKKYSKYGSGIMDQPDPTQRVIPRRNGAKNSNYGQLRKGEKEGIINCAIECLNANKKGTLDAKFLEGIGDKWGVKTLLGEMLTQYVEGNTKIGPHFDLIYETYNIISSVLSESIDVETSTIERLVEEAFYESDTR